MAESHWYSGGNKIVFAEMLSRANALSQGWSNRRSVRPSDVTIHAHPNGPCPQNGCVRVSTKDS